jgi:hypothetical protein
LTYLEKVEWFKKELSARTFTSLPAKLNWMWVLACQLFAFGGVPEDKVQQALKNADEEQKTFVEDAAMIERSDSDYIN